MNTLPLKNRRVCKKGHVYYKTSDSLTCPMCEKIKAPRQGILSSISAPARRALEAKGIKTPRQLSIYTEKEILSLHGMGKNGIEKLKSILKEEGLLFKK